MENIALEIRAAEGGEDSRLFTRDLALGYKKLCLKKDWSFQITSDAQNELVIEITGKDLSGLKNEAGGHRIQRIPPTERKGRVHTSTVTVAVIDLNQKVDFTVKDSDLKIEWYSGTGAGGQHRNKHQNSCRITHLPTGTIVTSQCRSRQNSLEEARSALLKKLYKEASASHYALISDSRKKQVGSGMRGDKIRTYRFQDDIVQDHLTNREGSCIKVLKGNFDLLWR